MLPVAPGTKEVILLTRTELSHFIDLIAITYSLHALLSHGFRYEEDMSKQLLNGTVVEIVEVRVCLCVSLCVSVLFIVRE